MSSEIGSNIIAQWGAIGIMIFGLIWFAKYMFVHFMLQQKANIEEIKKLQEESNKKDSSFIDYLIIQAKEHHDIIKENTRAISHLVDFFDKSFVGYMKSRTEAHDRLSENLNNFMDKIEETL